MHQHLIPPPLIIASFAALAPHLHAQASTHSPAEPTKHVDKSQYHLLNPTPRHLRRELAPDRPDTTESALTVDAGHAAVEVSIADWSHDQGDQAIIAMHTNFKLGLTNRSDLQFVFDSYTWEHPQDSSRTEGFNDIQIRYKYNLWGNDQGNTALAFFPYVKVPTGTSLSNGKWEGGLMLPFSMPLTDHIELGLMGQLDYLYNDTTSQYEFELLHTAVLGFELTEQFGLFTEYVGVAAEEGYLARFVLGGTYTVSEDLILDCGGRLGLTDNAEDYGFFTGFTKRF